MHTSMASSGYANNHVQAEEPASENSTASGVPTQQAATPMTPLQISEPLRNALAMSRDRSFIFQIERDLQNFISSNTDSYLLAPMNSYYRLITHHTAEYYSLGHTVNEGTKSILVFKQFGVQLRNPPPLVVAPAPFMPPNGAYPAAYRMPMPYPQPMMQVPPQPVSISPPVPQPIPHNFKLMKRPESATPEPVEEKETEDGSKSKESGAEDQNGGKKDLDGDLATRESEYQKARQRIFEEGRGSSDESEEEEEDENGSYAPSTRPMNYAEVPAFYPDQMLAMSMNMNMNMQIGMNPMFYQQFPGPGYVFNGPPPPPLPPVPQGYPQYPNNYNGRGGYKKRASYRKKKQ